MVENRADRSWNPAAVRQKLMLLYAGCPGICQVGLCESYFDGDKSQSFNHWVNSFERPLCNTSLFNGLCLRHVHLSTTTSARHLNYEGKKRKHTWSFFLWALLDWLLFLNFSKNSFFWSYALGKIMSLGPVKIKKSNSMLKYSWGQKGAILI